MSRFSLIYRPPADRSDDSEKARVRLLEKVSGFYYDMERRHLLARAHREELGLNIRTDTAARDLFLETGRIEDVLDAVTIIYNNLRAIASSVYYAMAMQKQWKDFAERVFREENLPYTVADDGIVHFYEDVDFQYTRASVIKGLAERVPSVHDDLEKAYNALDDSPPNTKLCLQRSFEALENLAKLVLRGKLARLAPNDVERTVKPYAQAAFASGSAECRAAGGLIDGMKGWVTVLQEYRHAQESEEIRRPPMDLTVGLLSAGVTYIRFLVSLAAANEPGADPSSHPAGI
jgi:hypothetical protein